MLKKTLVFGGNFFLAPSTSRDSCKNCTFANKNCTFGNKNNATDICPAFINLPTPLSVSRWLLLALIRINSLR